MRPSILIGIISSKEMGSGVSRSKIRLRLTIMFGSHHCVITTLRLLIMPIQILTGADRIKISLLHEIPIRWAFQKFWVHALVVHSAVREVIVSVPVIFYTQIFVHREVGIMTRLQTR